MHEFNGFALGAELGVRVDADFDFAIGVFLHFVSEVFHGFVHGDVFALVVGEFEGDGGLATGSEAKGKGGGKFPGKCPLKNSSFIVTFFIATKVSVPFFSITLSTNKKGYLCGSIFIISSIVIIGSILIFSS